MKWILFAILAVAVTTSGCATVHSKMLAAKSQHGYPYSGVSMDAIAVACAWKLPAVAKKEDGTSYFVSVPVAVASSAVFLADAPLSFAADSLWLPFDLAAKPVHERWTFSNSCNASGRI